jgi:hypothetical protein
MHFWSNAGEEYAEEELYKLFNEPDIKHIKINRLSSTGHIMRMENSKTVNVFGTRPEGSRGILEGPN